MGAKPYTRPGTRTRNPVSDDNASAESIIAGENKRREAFKSFDQKATPPKPAPAPKPPKPRASLGRPIPGLTDAEQSRGEKQFYQGKIEQAAKRRKK